MAEEESPRRTAGGDAVLVLALVAIVAADVWRIEGVHRWVFSWSVPLLFMLSGYRWVLGRSRRVDLRAGFLGIGRPYLVWWLITAAVFALATSTESGRVPLKPLGLAAWGGAGAVRPWDGFWVVSTVFIAVLLVRFIWPAGWWWALGFAYVATVAAFAEPDAARGAPLASVAAVGCTGFVLFGIGLRAVRHRVGQPVLTGIAAVVLGLAGILVPEYHAPHLQAADFGTPFLGIVVAMMIGSGLIVLGASLDRLIPASFGRGLGAVAECTIAVLLSHGIVLYFLDTPKRGGWLDFALALAVPLAVALLARRTVLSPWLVGVPETARGTGRSPAPSAMFRRED